jgi:hypothetical protein
MRLAWSSPRDSEARRRYAAEALRWLDREDAALYPADVSTADEYRHLSRLASMAMMAFESGDFGRAETMAAATLRLPEVASQVIYTPEMRNWRADPGDRAVHDGHIVLGKIALARGDVDDATHRLKLAANAASGSDGNMATIGPDLWLAQDLLGRGRAEAVLDYLLACRDAWILGGSAVDRWTRQIRAGESPRLEIRGRPPLRSMIAVFSG